MAEVAFAGPGDVRRAVESARARPAGLGRAQRARARQVPVPHRAPDPGARARAGDRRVDGRRQADPRVARRGRAARRGALLPLRRLGRQALLRRWAAAPCEPLGVAAQIVPWNFPLLMAAWKLAPALACGNTAVLKPAETTPLTALLLAEILQEAELPPGVVSILPGDGVAGAALVREPDIDKVAFTGSTGVGKDIQAALAGRGIPLTLELGGKSANIVFEDAAIDQAVEGIVQGIFFNQGHVCCAGSRLLIQESVADDGRRRSSGRGWRACAWAIRSTRTPTWAPSTRASSSTGSRRWWRAGEEEGAVRRTVSCELPDRGFWFAPTLFTDVAPAHRIAAEEIFGPVVSVLTFRTQAEAIEKANSTPYGLAAGIWTDKGVEGIRGGERASGRASSGRTPTTTSTRPPHSVATRRAASAARAGWPGSAATCAFRHERAPAGPQDLQAVHRRARSCARSRAATTAPATSTSRAGRARTCATRWPPRARPPRAGPARTAYNRGQILYRFAEALESRARGHRRAGRPRSARPIDVLVHYAGWTDKLQPVLGGINPVAAPFLSFSLPEPTGVVGRDRARRARAAGPGRRAGARAGGRQHAGRRALREGAAARPRPRRGARHRRRAGRRREPAVRAPRASWPRRWPATTRSTRSSTRPRTTSSAPRSTSSPPSR